MGLSRTYAPTETTDPECNECLDRQHRQCCNPLEKRHDDGSSWESVQVCCCGYADLYAASSGGTA